MHRAVEIYRAVENASLKKILMEEIWKKKTKTFCPRNFMFLVYNIVW